MEERLKALKQQIQQAEAMGQIPPQMQQKFEQAEKELLRQEAVLKASKKELAKGKKELQASKRKLNSSASLLRKKEKELKNGELKIYEAEKKLSDARKELKKGEKEYSLTTMTRMVEEQRTQIGILKALGYTGFDVAKKYGLYALLATAGGSIIGVLVGETILPKIIIEAYSMMYTGIGPVKHPFETRFALTASAASVCITLGATMFACYKELREKPAQLMRPEAPNERIGILWRHLNFTWKSTLRNLFRYKKRFFMTIFGIGGCMALLLVGFGLKDSIFAISKNQYQNIMTYDASVTLEDDLSAKKEQEIASWIQKQHTIPSSTKIRSVSVDLEFDGDSKSASLFVPEDAKGLSSYIRFKDRISGEKYRLSDNGIILTEKVCSLLGIKIGDTVIIKEGETKTVRAKVEHITENYMHHNIYMSKDLYQKLYGEEPEYNQILLKDKDRSEKTETDLGKGLLKQEGVASVSFISDFEKEMNDMLNNLNIVVFVLIVSAGLLAFVVLYNLNNINIAERKAELATLKVLGFYDLETAAYVYRENILLTVIGTAVGAGLGILLHRYVILTAEVDLIMFGRQILPPSYLYSVLLTIGFAALINFMMFFQLRKISMVESLKSTE